MVRSVAVIVLLGAFALPAVCAAQDGEGPRRQPAAGSALFPMAGPQSGTLSATIESRCAPSRDRDGNRLRVLVRSGPVGCVTGGRVLRGALAGHVPAGWTCRRATVRAAGLACYSKRDPLALLFSARPSYRPRCAAGSRTFHDPCYTPAAVHGEPSQFDGPFHPCSPAGWPTWGAVSYARLLAERFDILATSAVPCATVRPAMREVVGQLTLGFAGLMPDGWRCERAPRRQSFPGALVGCELPGGAFTYAVTSAQLP